MKEQKQPPKKPQPKKQVRVKKVKVPKNRPTPFDIKVMLRSLHETEYLSGEDLRQAVAPLLVKHRRKLPTDFTVEDCVKLMRERGWIILGRNPADSEFMLVKIQGIKARNRVGKKIVGYQNPNNDQGKIEPVYQLTKDERQRKSIVAALKHTIEAGERAKKKLGDIRGGKCNHRVFKDFPGAPYNIRECCLCGSHLGLV